ncbi:hypothetical protein COCSUDRAFT_33835 [Coccomyxa subellipsoidea C-169]|uniref:Uncharacterized protein n=1 Tax=Coccomyxa subellipsoidea (strain C-169) TaxID=574566 RepID=I0YS71_COCSC|nr:hypothetical protein COCSUDRAFT_33835 [Coccomyxa subellipsoidea C-169]EIE21240.1 hypothetical protein COCSUDRAFT_33835 [Coccomyxa subellipsoidea C-169]|eukprot:XP_005645784.1 hypothetical protein COCSUDRAFT_33835 [Coccomyxa subellipsoidea C-169]
MLHHSRKKPSVFLAAFIRKSQLGCCPPQGQLDLQPLFEFKSKCEFKPLAKRISFCFVYIR